MTLDETRDRLALLIPGDWTRSPDGIWAKREWGDDYVRSIRAGLLPSHGHPVDPTMNKAHAILTEAGWCWERTSYQWKARTIQRPRGEDIVLWDAFVPDTGNPTHDLLTLALKALEQKGTR